MKGKQIPSPSGNSLEKYFQEINKYPLLSQEEELELARRWKKEGDIEAAHKLTVCNLRFVVKIANEYRHYNIRLADLIQEGNLGLMMAIKKFDPDKGVRLISYAVWWIRAQIQNYILQNWRLIKIGTTQSQRKLFYKLEKTKRTLARIHGEQKAISSRELAEALDVTEDLVQEMEIRLGTQELSIDSKFGADSDDGRSLVEILPDHSPDPEENFSEEEFESFRRQKLYEALECLDEREKLIIQRRRLIEDPDTLSEIGKDLGITRERVRQLEARAIKKLREYLQNKKFKDIVQILPN